MKCRICTTELTKKNRSPVKGVCRADFRFSSRRVLEKLSDPTTYGRPIRDTAPAPSSELHALHLASLSAPLEYELEADLTEGQLKLLKEIRRKKITGINYPMPYPEASLSSPKTKKEPVMLQVQLTDEEQVQLERMRVIKKWEGR